MSRMSSSNAANAHSSYMSTTATNTIYTPTDKKQLANDAKSIASTPYDPSDYHAFANDLFNDVEKSDELVRLLVSSVEYQGFSPDNTFKALYYREQDMTKLLADVRFLLTLFLARGNNMTKAVARMDEKAKIKVIEVLGKYHIVPNANYAPGNYTVTLSRIAAAFPLVTIRLLYGVDTIPRPVHLSHMEAAGFTDFPKHFQTSCIFTIAPNKSASESDYNKKRSIIQACLHHQILEASILSKGKTPDLTTVLVYARAAFTTGVLTEDQRKAAWRKYTSSLNAATIGAWLTNFSNLYPLYTEQQYKDTFGY